MNQLVVLQVIENLPLNSLKELAWIRFREILNHDTKSGIVQNFLPIKKSPIALYSKQEIDGAIAAQKQLVDAITEEVFYEIVGQIAVKLMEESHAKLTEL